MITMNVISRTFQLKCGNQHGTCFTIDVDHKQYICTAAHCLIEFNGRAIELFHENKWKELKVKIVGYSSKGTDICVLSSEILLSPSLPLLPDASGIALGQDTYFLGFPLGIQASAGEINRHYAMPLVKKATLSGICFENPKTLLLDGHNNLGFSGGPVVFQKKPGSEFFVASIVSAYNQMPEPIFDTKGNKTPLRYHANMGIVVSYLIDYALDVIHTNPIGCEISG